MHGRFFHHDEIRGHAAERVRLVRAHHVDGRAILEIERQIRFILGFDDLGGDHALELAPGDHFSLLVSWRDVEYHRVTLSGSADTPVDRVVGLPEFTAGAQDLVAGCVGVDLRLGRRERQFKFKSDSDETFSFSEAFRLLNSSPVNTSIVDPLTRIYLRIPSSLIH